MAEPTRRQAPQAGWSTWPEGCTMVLRGATFHVASRVALVVGTLLTLVNQGGVLMGGDHTSMTWVRIAANFLIPYVVASIGYLAPLRRRS